jgi:hypothetical protein
MNQASRVVRHYVLLGILWLFFAASASLANRDQIPHWSPLSTSQFEWTAITLYVVALIVVSFHQARITAPRLPWLWLEIFVTLTSFALTASALTRPVYDDVIDREESAAPFIIFGGSALALGIATFPSSYILWRRYGQSALKVDPARRIRSHTLS